MREWGLRVTQGEEQERSFIGTKEAAKLLSVAPTTVQRWIDSGILRSYRTPGGHRRVRRNDMAEFGKEHKYPLPPGLGESSGARVLLVDDSSSTLKMLKRKILEKFPDVAVETATNGIEALLKIGHAKPDVMILDIILPEMDGVEVIRRIKKTRSYDDIKILAITAYGKKIGDRAMAAGATAFFAKNDLARMFDALATLLAAGARGAKTE